MPTLTFSWNDEGGRIGAEVEEELSDDVAGEQAIFADRMIAEAHDAEQNGQDDEAAHLDWLATNSIHSGCGDPVTRYCACTDEDEIADGDVVEDAVNTVAFGISDRLKDRCVVETDTIESHVKEEP